MSEQQPVPPADDQFDPASSHGSDLDPRIDDDNEQPEQTPGTDEAAAAG